MSAYAGIGVFGASAESTQLLSEENPISFESGQQQCEPDGAGGAADPGNGGENPGTEQGGDTGSEPGVEPDIDPGDGSDETGGAEGSDAAGSGSEGGLISEDTAAEDQANINGEIELTSVAALLSELSEEAEAAEIEADFLSAVENAAPGDTITLNGDIWLTETLVVPVSLILTSDENGPYRIIGPAGSTAIYVTGGILTLQNVIVTHDPGAEGRGIEVHSNAGLILNGGTVSGNSVTGNGGGILMEGFFEMNGGSISGNTAGGSGGGIYFTNSSTSSGAIYINEGNISGNKAIAGNGGGICFDNIKRDYGKLVITASVTFSNNIASKGYRLGPNDTEAINMHNAKIAAGIIWSGSYEYGYNNYDISYIPTAPPVVYYTVTFDLQGGVFPAGPGTLTVQAGGTPGDKMPGDPVLDGYVFKGWLTNTDGTGTPFTSDTVITGHITVYAIWEAVIQPPIPPSPPEPPPGPVITPPPAEPPAVQTKPLAAVVKPPAAGESEPAAQVSAEAAAEVITQQQTPAAGLVPQAILLSSESILTFSKTRSPEVVLAILKDRGVPILSLGGLEMPLSAGIGLPVWAPVNQVLVSVGIVMAISAFIGYLRRRRQTGEQPSRRLNMAVVFAVTGAVVFALTQNTVNLMVLFDIWTPVNAAIFLGVLINVRSITAGRKETAYISYIYR